MAIIINNTQPSITPALANAYGNDNTPPPTIVHTKLNIATCNDAYYHINNMTHAQ
jgi:hypothetical protein